jgi:hypothetical protein
MIFISHLILTLARRLWKEKTNIMLESMDIRRLERSLQKKKRRKKEKKIDIYICLWGKKTKKGKMYMCFKKKYKGERENDRVLYN